MCDDSNIKRSVSLFEIFLARHEKNVVVVTKMHVKLLTHLIKRISWTTQKEFKPPFLLLPPQLQTHNYRPKDCVSS